MVRSSLSVPDRGVVSPGAAREAGSFSVIIITWPAPWIPLSIGYSITTGLRVLALLGCITDGPFAKGAYRRKELQLSKG